MAESQRVRREEDLGGYREMHRQDAAGSAAAGRARVQDQHRGEPRQRRFLLLRPAGVRHPARRGRKALGDRSERDALLRHCRPHRRGRQDGCGDRDAAPCVPDTAGGAAAGRAAGDKQEGEHGNAEPWGAADGEGWGGEGTRGRGEEEGAGGAEEEAGGLSQEVLPEDPSSYKPRGGRKVARGRAQGRQRSSERAGGIRL
mmetsp:Transcript_35774/g.111908  ORF Transcript_35774/g.111908 Transcript_35774/m.111908 type:complete len:200 (-) Transcript_35774:421-1020(-)